MAQRTIGAILNEASDSTSRDAESSRRAAITSVSLKGELSNQRYRETEFADKEADRSRANEYREELKKVYDKHLFFDEAVPSQQGAAIPEATPNGNFPSQQTVRKSYQPGSREWMKGLSSAMAEKSSLDLRYGLAKPEDMNQMLEFRKKLEATGASEDFLAAMRGDKGAAARVSEKFGISGLQSIESGYDDNGLLNFFAMTNRPGPGGAMESKRVPVGHLMAAYSPEIDSMLKANREQVNATDTLATSATSRRNQTTQAGASATSAAASMLNARTNERTNTARAEGQGSHITLAESVNKRAPTYRLPQFTERDASGKAQAVPDDEAASIVTEIGGVLIDNDGLGAGEAFSTASNALSAINNKTLKDYNAELEAARAADKAARASGDSAARREAGNRLYELERNGSQWFQNQRQTYLDRWRASISAASQSANSAPAEK
jgi:hypothetical protein